MKENNAAQAVEQDPINAAILLLTEEADSISDCHTRTPGDWAGEPEAKAHYDHVRSVVDALSKLRAPVADERAAFSRAEISFPLTIPENRVYLAGPMSGIAEHNFPAFHAAADRLRGSGLEVVNPADHGLVEGLGWSDYMRWDLVKLAGCHAVYVLPGWEKSKGASLEIAIARALGMPVFTVEGAALASAPVADEKPDESNSPVPLAGHSMGPLTPIYDHVGSLIGQALATARHGAYEGSIVWTRMRHAGEWMPWHVAGKQSAPVAGEAQPSRQTLLDAIWRHGNARAMAEHNIAYRDEVRNTADALIALFDAAPQASAEQMQAALQKSFDMGKFYGSLPETDAEDVRNAALEEAYEAVACLYAAYYQHSKRSESDDILQALKQAGDDIRALKQPQADKDGCTCPSGDGSLRHPCPMHPGADKDGGQQRAGDGKTREAGDYTRGGALNFDDPAPAGPEGIRSQFNACMHRNECRAMLDRQPKLRADASAVRRALIAASNYIDTLGGDSKSYRAALYAPQAEQGERDAG